jgi:hypothetical protein
MNAALRLFYESARLCPVPEIDCLSPQVSWLFFKAVRAGLAVATSILHEFCTPSDLDLSSRRKNGAGRVSPLPGRASSFAARRLIRVPAARLAASPEVRATSERLPRPPKGRLPKC